MQGNLRFTNKTAIVTGSAKGIGKGVAVRLAHEGASIVVADVDGDEAGVTAREIVAEKGSAVPYAINIANVSEIQGLVDAAVKEFGKIDYLVNTAGIVQSKPFLDVTEAEWNRIIDVNLRGAVFCMQAVGAHMLARVPKSVKQNGVADRCYGKIVNFSSISGRRGRPLQIHYAASKAAIISVTQSAALFFAPFGINVNAISPSVVLTQMWEENNKEKALHYGTDVETSSREFFQKIPLRRPGTVEEMAAAVAFLCSPDSDYITGQTLNVDGGFEMD